MIAGHVLAAEPSTLRIGYQKSSVSMVLGRVHKLFEAGLPGTQVLELGLKEAEALGYKWPVRYKVK